MARFEERIYELALAALAEQERRASDVRSRGATLLAAAAVVASLFSRSVFQEGHPNGPVEVAATGFALGGAGGALVAAVVLLRPYELAFTIGVAGTYRALRARGAEDQPVVDIVLADALDARSSANESLIASLERTLVLGLVGLVIETVGFASAVAVAL